LNIDSFICSSSFVVIIYQVVAAKETGTEAPVKRIENCSFLYTRHLNMYFVALTRSNVNPALAFEYMFQLIKILKAYLGEDFDENSMRNNMTLIYELMDETMDFGYPQVRFPIVQLKFRMILEPTTAMSTD